jgi:phosphatidylglycerophosphatase A
VKINFLEKLIGSGLYTGYLPKAPGTWGSLAAMILFLIPGFENPSLMILIISFSILISVPIAVKFESIYGEDPGQFTFDEFIGMWITLLFIPKKIWFILLAFLIWRAMDILKPFPVRKLESVKNGWGVVLDDVLAGIYSFIIIQILIYVYNSFII